jgi:hypothetical protein
VRRFICREARGGIGKWAFGNEGMKMKNEELPHWQLSFLISHSSFFINKE